MAGFFGGLFDFNHDGKMSAFEKTAEFAAFARIIDSVDATEKVNELESAGIDITELESISHAIIVLITVFITPLHRDLLHALQDKNVFVLSTNADGQFVKAGLPNDKIFVPKEIIFIYNVVRPVTIKYMMQEKDSLIF